ncbi:chemotaxis protein CheR [Allostella vacuolata]|nr:chemotaxis protein CheR [Stella vacuolata]
MVGIGASAGGIEALEGFFRGIRADSGAAYAVVTHLSPERESLLHEIIGRYTDMPVHVASDGVAIEPDHVYVLPANAVLGIADGKLTIQRAEGRIRKPIDVFFSALATECGPCAAAVVLSGGDGDGSLGIKAIKEHGGLTLAQTPDGFGPRHPDMPRTAIATGLVDFAVPVEEMGARLADFADRLRALEVGGDTDQPPELAAARGEIYAILRNQLGHDFSGYKKRTFGRRVQRRMQVTQADSVEDYIARLEQDPDEATALFRDLLINVTSFFRDDEAFEALGRLVVPRLLEGRGATDTVRIWVPACATGEEAFSLAILLSEQLQHQTARPRIQIFATDIDELALNVARAARFPRALLEGMSAERLARFFTYEDGSYVLNKEQREMCIFSPHSVIRDPPFSRLDLVSCRNLLIYFGPQVQAQVIPIFHYALRPGGFLFLGIAENIGEFGDIFVPVDKKQRIFRTHPDRVADARVPGALATIGRARIGGETRDGRQPLAGVRLREAIESHVAERFAPAHVVTSRDGEIVYYSARTGRYLEAPPGPPSRQLLTSVRRGLRLDLRTVFHEVVHTLRPAAREGIPFEDSDGRMQRVRITVEPLMARGEEARLFIVVFAETGESTESQDAQAEFDRPSEVQTEFLESELRNTREHLQSLIEEYETALEELKASNEELFSANEELQSTNEELESSKEEMQSINEELETVNHELAGKLEQLDVANNDIVNLLESSRIATIFMDCDMAIRSFTPAVTTIFRIQPGDRGRPITDFATRVDFPTLEDDLRTVLRTGSIIERHVDHDTLATHYLVRVVPYRTSSSPIAGVVATFIDVTGLKQAEAQLQVLVAELQHRVKNMLTVVISIARQTMKTTGSVAAFHEAFTGRVHAMARSFSVLARENWGEASIGEIVRQELDPFGPERIRAEGPEIRLRPHYALSIAMVVHELATNAAKHGALSADGGRLAIRWTTEPDPAGDRIVLD